MTLTPPRGPGFACRPLALAVLLLAAQAQGIAQTATEARAIEIPAQPAAQALQLFVKQQNFQLLYAPELVRGLTSKPVSGSMSPRAALARMLEGSGLQIIDTGPNAATLRAAGPGNGPSTKPAPAAAEAGNEPPAKDSSPAPAAPRTHRFELAAGEALQTLQQAARIAGVELSFSESDLRDVRTNRIDGEFSFAQAVQQMLAGTQLSLGQRVDSGSYVVRRGSVLPRVEVTGSNLRSILGEQSVNPVTVLTRQDIERSGVTTLAELRNLIPQLSNGAAASFNGNSGGTAPDGRLLFDLRGLQAGNTLILVDGLRLPRTGSRSVAEAYEATGIPMSAIERVEVLLGGGSAVYGADAVGGVVNIITRKRYSGTEFEIARDDTLDTDAANDRVTLSHALRRGAFTARAMLTQETQNALARRDRWWLASDDRRYLGGSNSTTNNAFIGGTVSAMSGNLPGLGVATAHIPLLADGRTATIADYAAAVPTDRYDAGKVQNALNPYKRRAASLYAEYEFARWANAYLNYSWSHNESEAPGDPVRLTSSTSTSPTAPNPTWLPAGYPGNPFGVPIRVDKYLWELGTPARRYSMRSHSSALGLRGELPHDWRYQLTLSQARSVPELPDAVFQFDASRISPAIRSSTPPILLHNSLNLMQTGGTAPNADGTLEAFYYQDARQDIATTRMASLKVDGPIWQLEAGPVNLALGAERRVDSLRFTTQVSAAGLEANQPADDRIVSAQFAELAIPLLSPKSSLQLPLVHSLVLTGALRRDVYKDFGSAEKPLVGAIYKPVSWLALRATRNEAFRVPYLIDLTRTRSTSTLSVPATGSQSLIDTYRKNEPFVGPLLTTTGGNPDLKPESSTHHNFGLIFESPWEIARGLSFSIDRWSSEILNRVGSLSRQDRLLYFPDTYTRAALTPADAAAGYTVGRITAVDSTSVNIARYSASGYDYSLRFQRMTPWGEFTLSSKVTRTDRVESIATPGALPSSLVSAKLRPARAVSSVSWAYRGGGLSLTHIHQDGFPVSLTTPIVEYPKTQQINANFWYDFGVGSWHDKEGLLGTLFHNTRLSFGLINAEDSEPPLSPTGNLNNSVDPRGMRYTFSLRRRF